jgi:hypothetical protein
MADNGDEKLPPYTKGSGDNPRSPFHFNIIDLIERRIQFFSYNPLEAMYSAKSTTR